MDMCSILGWIDFCLNLAILYAAYELIKEIRK
jgi:hypothetical protein